MPELVEVEHFRRFIEKHLPCNPIVENIYFHDAKSLFPNGHPNMKSIPPLVIQKKVTQVQRYGKYLWLELDNPRVYILLHFGMTGSLAFRNGDGSIVFARVGASSYSSWIQEWPSNYAKMRLLFSDGSELAFLETRKLGKIVVTEQDPMQSSFISCLGFDPILSQPSVDELYDKIKHCKGAIKTVLCSGSVIAGIGNWMADEILHAAKIHPLESTNKLSRSCVALLWEATQQIVQQGIRVDANGDAFPKDWLFHCRWRKQSDICQRGITKIRVGGRTTWLVPLHQPLRTTPIEEEHTCSGDEMEDSQQFQVDDKPSPSSEKHMRDIYRSLCGSKENGITEQDLQKVVSELDSARKWQDNQVIKDAITLFSSNGSCICWEDFVKLYHKVQETNSKP